MNTLYRSMVEAAVNTALAAGRHAAELEHKGLRGRAREIFVSDLLSPFLYPSMELCTGVMIDSYGRQSDQTDVIVFDKCIVPPIRYNPAEGTIPCEAVLFAIEIKSVATSGEIRSSIEWARSVKELRFSPSLFRGLVINQINSVPCALFAFDTDLAQGSFENEWQRLQTLVAEQDNLRVPLSALTIATRGHLECVDARATPPRFDRYAADPPPDAVVRFVAWMMRHAAALRAQRSPISLDDYLLKA